MPVSGTMASSTVMMPNAIISSWMAFGVTGMESSVTTVMLGRPSCQSRWLHQQHQHHQYEHHGVGGFGIKILGQSLDHAEREPRDDRSHDRTHAADHNHREHHD